MGIEVILGIAAVLAPIIIRAIKARIANRDPNAPDNGPLGLGLRNRLRNRRNPQPAVPPLPVQPEPVAPPLPPQLPTVPMPKFQAFEDGETVGIDPLCDEVAHIFAVCDRLREIARKSPPPEGSVAGRVGPSPADYPQS